MQEEQGYQAIELTPVVSSQIAAIGHDAASNTLAVKFSSGSTYHYSGVSAEDFAAFKDADSIGSHFGKTIRGKFDSVRLPEEKAEVE
jgi:hypothetical protein